MSLDAESLPLERGGEVRLTLKRAARRVLDVRDASGSRVYEPAPVEVVLVVQ